VPSTSASSQSDRPCSLNMSRNACEIRTSTSSTSQSIGLLRQVLGDGKCWGKSRRWAALRSHYKMPSKHARLSARGRPSLVALLACGMNGLIDSQCSWLSKTSCCRAILRLPSRSWN
jgi:hypothetical protein